ncbi:winged helix-turn-helix domain-containing protein [Phytomonospora sp. NPDC050363]|uniref:ArsR/SmtB family transcription factor n=1 Tax=Phytomonospora sp. NPDC050363 TaxID=3155642 RepID=UPI0033D6D1AF
MTDPQAAPLAELASVLADKTRAAILLALLDGRAWTAGELARHAEVAPSTVSGHLTRLAEARFVTYYSQGRHRYVRITDPEVAELLENLTSRLDAPLPKVTSLKGSNRQRALATARTCYDHLAGRLGVAVADALVREKLVEVDEHPLVTGAGERWFAELGVDLGSLRGKRRPVLRECIDWTERRPHLAGAAASGLRETVTDRGWVVRVGDTRGMRVTEEGYGAFADLLGITRQELMVG